MNRLHHVRAAFGACTLLLVLGACSEPAGDGKPQDHADGATAATNRIDVPDAVRRNLGLQFHTVGRRRVASTLRLPGHFELLPKGRLDHRMPLPGRVLLHVAPLARVAAGDLLFTIDSPQWHATQHALAELVATLAVTESRLQSLAPLLAAHERHERSLEEAAQVLQERVDSLQRTREAVGGQAAELATARVQLAQMRAETTEAAEKHTETTALQAELRARLEADRTRLTSLLRSAQSQHGMPVEALLAEDAQGRARWRTLDVVEVRAQLAGVVAEVADCNGAWLETGAHVLEVADPSALRFVASAMQSDLPRLDDGLPVRVVAPTAGTGSDTGLASGAGQLQLGALADPAQRSLGVAVSLDTVPAWARHGIAAYAEVETAASAPEVLAVPLAAIVEHGLSKVLFLRNPKDPDQVIRVEADLGVDDGRWVEVRSELADGDQVVVAGAYALVLASAPAMQGGHFHADGTWHADDHK